MNIIDVFMEKSKHVFLNSLIKIPKEYDWYLGIILKLDSDDILTNEEFEKKCNKIYEKSEKHLKLLKICLIDNFTFLLFGVNPTPFLGDIKKIVKSICKYLNCKIYEITFVKNFNETIFDVWGEQQYFYLIDENKAIDLKFIN